MDHYYSKKPTSKSNEQTWTAEINHKEYSFITDHGVFSKDKIDVGSEVLIKTASRSNFPEGDFLDIGCGYGPIGLSLAREYPTRKIEMLDVNERALDLAKRNAELNGIKNISVYASSLFSNVSDKKYAAIFSNPPIRAGKKVVHQLLEDAYNYLKEGGALQIVIQKKQGAPSAKMKMFEVFGNVERIALEKGYWILESRKN